MERFGITVSGQLLELCQFGGVGLLLGVVYELFRLLRLLTRATARGVFLQDVLYFVLAAAITQVLALPISSGRVRLVHFLALILGFALYYFTVGQIVYRLMRLVVYGVQVLGARLSRPVHSLFAWLAHLLTVSGEKMRKIAKKIKKIFKNPLQQQAEI